ncbi:hypothetical protein TNCV_900701 [Trichonephila clavipes]|nr:hypothetical protein TNCV_900701 [Trichonephila clavipes]
MTVSRIWNRWVQDSKAEFTPRLSASSVKRLANQRLHLGQNEVSDWLDARHSALITSPESRIGVVCKTSAYTNSSMMFSAARTISSETMADGLRDGPRNFEPPLRDKDDI